MYFSLYPASFARILFLRSIHFVVYISSSFLFLLLNGIYSIYLYLNLCYKLFTPFISWGTFGLFLVWSFHEWSCYNQAFVCPVFSLLLRKHLGVELGWSLDHTVNAYLTFKKLPSQYPKWLKHFIFSPAMYENSSCFTSLPTLGNISFLIP